jgi:hypothetical protein
VTATKYALYEVDCSENRLALRSDVKEVADSGYSPVHLKELSLNSFKADGFKSCRHQ